MKPPRCRRRWIKRRTANLLTGVGGGVGGGTSALIVCRWRRRFGYGVLKHLGCVGGARRARPGRNCVDLGRTDIVTSAMK